MADNLISIPFPHRRLQKNGKHSGQRESKQARKNPEIENDGGIENLQFIRSTNWIASHNSRS